MRKGSAPNAADLKKEAELQELVALEEQIEEWETICLELEEPEEKEKCELELADLRLQLKEKLAVKGPYDDCDCWVRVSAGEGGTEANDWTRMLAEMYQKFADKNGYKWEIADWSDGTVTGYKFVQMRINAPYGSLKNENGVHRLVRVSPFDSKGRRHTSFAAVEILPVLDAQEVKNVEINPADLKVDTFRSGGPGGQYQNTTESGVRITHLPTGLVAESREERSQLQNKNKAMSRLLAKLALYQEEEKKKELESISEPKQQNCFGSQIRSYIFMPYQMVKNEITGFSVGNVYDVLNGNFLAFGEEGELGN